MDFWRDGAQPVAHAALTVSIPDGFIATPWTKAPLSRIGNPPGTKIPYSSGPTADRSNVQWLRDGHCRTVRFVERSGASRNDPAVLARNNPFFHGNRCRSIKVVSKVGDHFRVDFVPQTRRLKDFGGRGVVARAGSTTIIENFSSPRRTSRHHPVASR